MKKHDKQIIVLKDTTDWVAIEEGVQNAVVQIFAQVGRFNWLEPYTIEEQAENRGSGFIINQDGYIVTNAHVVDEAKRIWVHIPSLGRQIIHVEIVGFCPDRELALLRIKPNDLTKLRAIFSEIPYLSFGDSDLVQRTYNVLVLGYPLGQYRLKGTTGVVSGREASKGQALIQITAPINPGSSGGPLLNEHGQVIGIAMAIIEEAANVGYAIPINELKLMLDELYTKRLVRTPFLGIQFVYANDNKAAYLGNPEPAGLYVSKVLKGSLCEHAGVRVGDMLYEFDGHALDAYGDTAAPWGFDKTSLSDLIARCKVGQTVKMVLYRNGERKEISFVMDLTKLYPIRQMYPDYEKIEYEMIAGMVLFELADNHLPLLLEEAPDLVIYAQVENKMNFVIVITHILPGSLAQQLRTLLPGDIITHVNDKQVSTLATLRQALLISMSTGYLTIKTRRDVFAVLAMEQVFEDEVQMSRDFVYPISATVQDMLKKRSAKA